MHGEDVKNTIGALAPIGQRLQSLRKKLRGSRRGISYLKEQ